ncbi:AI-2E family transporter [Cryobacterium sp. 1639]|uniref:AI-2E family transporter n=1 Tax=Cryobacterium inferilacus TaxID=2866629 RepID=UPI0027E2708D|nr:AI-2E family transporter [Cryobacterium sp. 1639]
MSPSAAREAPGGEPAIVAPPVMSHRNTSILVGLGGATVTVFGLAAIAGIAAPILLALVLTICAHPVRRGLERRGVPRGLATGSVVATVFIVLAAFVAAFGLALGQFAALLPQFASQLSDIGTTVSEWLATLGFGTAQVQAVEDSFDPSNLVPVVSGLFGSITNITVALVIVLTMLILMAADAGYLPTLLSQLRPTRPTLVVALTDFASSVRRYMVATTLLGIAQGALNAVALILLGVPGAFLWGLLSFLCSFIPNVGYFIAIIPPTVFAFLTGGWELALPVIVIYAIINAVVQSIVQPRVVGNAVALSQSLTFASVLFWAIVLGAIGAILAIPLTLLIRTILVDADPAAAWWRPLIGDLDETRTLMKVEDARQRALRKAGRAAKADAGKAAKASRTASRRP